jgi:hypothetical protein
MSEEIQTTKYSSYTPAQKRASQLYRQKNKDKINEQRKKYYQTRKASDPKFLEYKRNKAKEYYEKKKLDKVISPLPEVNTEMKETKCEVVDTIGLLKILVPNSPMVLDRSEPCTPKIDILIEPLSKMEIDVSEPSVQPSKLLKGKRSSKSKKVKTDLEKTD